MAATYPGGTKSFPARVNGTVIEDDYVNEPGDEITAVEADLLGAWSTRAFNAGHYFANTGVWTVEAGDVQVFAWKKLGKLVHITFRIEGSSTGPAAVSWVNITLPPGVVAARYSQGMLYIEEGAAISLGIVDVIAPGATWLRLFRNNLSAYAANLTNTLVLRGSITLEAQT